MTMKMIMTCAMVCSASLLFATVPETDGSGNMVFDITSDISPYTYSSVLSHNGGLIKRGVGQLNLTAASTSWKGAITVEAGILGSTGGGANCFGQNAYGTSEALTVLSGATLAPSDSANDYSLRTRHVHLTGTGAGGAGAVSYSGSTADYLFKDVTLEGDTTVTANGRFGFNGALYMKGHTLTKTGSGTFVLTGEQITDNPGNIIVNQGTLYIQNNATKITGTSANFLDMRAGTLSIWTMNTAENPIPWTLFMTNSAALTVNGSSSYWSGPVFIKNWLSPTIASSATLTFSGPVEANGLAAGEGTLVFGGSITNKGDLYGSKGTYVINGHGPHKLNTVALTGKCGVRIENAGKVDASGQIKVRGANISTMSVSGDTVLNSQRLWVAADSDAANNYGVFTLANGAFMTNNVSVGMLTGRGAFIVNDAFHSWLSDSADYNHIGGQANSYGYYAMNGGTAVWNGRTWTGSGVNSETTGGDGFIVQRGGLLTAETWATTVGGYGRGEHAIFGGAKFAMHYSSGEVSYYLGKNGKTDATGKGVLTISGEGSEMRIPNRVYCGSAGGFVAQINLNDGGTLAANRVRFYDSAWASGTKAFHLGFNGGVIKPTQSWGFSESKPPTSVTIYDGGMVYDTSECSTDYSTFQAPLSGPTGKGVASIALPTSAEFAAEKYIGPPVVTITGTGAAASALVDFDDATRTPKGVIITCPGFGYGADTTATVASADGKSSYACTVTMFDHTASGGFTKRGAGEVRLTQPSTYGGPTVIKAGTVKFEHASALPSDTTLTVDAGAVADLNNIARTVVAVGGTGTVSNGDLTVTDALHINCATAFGGGKLTVSGTLSVAGTRLVIDDPENLMQYKDAKSATFVTAAMVNGKPTEIVAADGSALPTNLKVSKIGNSLRFGFARGTVISVL